MDGNFNDADRLTKLSEDIRDWVRHMVARPQMFASCPEGLEDVVTALDRVSLMLSGCSPNTSPPLGYSAFLASRGFDAATFCSRKRNRPLTEEDKALFTELATFIEEYLESDASAFPH